MTVVTAQTMGLIHCHVCHHLAARDQTHCPRCHARMHSRKPHSVQRSWALLITAALLYIPAMILPVSTVTTLGRETSTTLAGSVVHFWESGAWPVALVIVLASILIPTFKLATLAYLLMSVRGPAGRNAKQQARLYRLLEFIGRWSMIDVFVVALLVGLVQFGPLSSVSADPGIVAFAAVVIVTMLATEAFDPRLIWDEPGRPTPP